MSKQEVLDFANQHPISYIATLDGDQPRVRGFLMWFADESGFYYHTSKKKRIFKQLSDHPRMEACFVEIDPVRNYSKQLRVAGAIEFLEDKELKLRLVEERPFLKAITGEGDPDYTSLAVFRIVGAEASFWTMEINTREREAEIIRF